MIRETGAPEIDTPVKSTPVGAGAPPDQRSIQFYGKKDGSVDMEFWFGGTPQRIPLDALGTVAVAIGDAAREMIRVSDCASAVEPFLQVLVDCGWVLLPPR